MNRSLLFVFSIVFSTLTFAQTTNSWLPNGNGSWMTPGNWSLGHVPLSTEKVLIDKNKNILISDVPSTSLTQMAVKNVASKTVTLEADALGNVLNITGGPGLDLDLTDHNVVLNLTGGLDLVMGTGTTGEMEKTFSGCNVTLSPASVFTIEGNGTPSFTVKNLTLKSGSAGPASLVVNSTSNPVFVVTDTTTVEQYLTGSQWHYVSSPVEDATANVYLNDYLRYYDEPAGDWSPYIVPTDPPLGTTQGFEAWTDVSSTKIFQGTLHSGDYTANVTRSWIPNWAPADTNGWNLVGNPYPSAVDWQSSGLGLTHIDPTVYYWNGSSYVSYNRVTHLGSGSRYIPPMQAFFVHVTRDMNKWTAGSIDFTNAARVNTSAQLYKDDPIFPDLLSLKADGNGYSDQVMISFNDTATNQFDWQLDNLKLEGNADVPQICTEMSDGTKISVNSMPWAGNMTEVPVSFTCGVAGAYSVTAGSLDSFDPAVQITMTDLLANKVVDLRTDSVYTFNHDPQFTRHRFLVQFYNPVMGNEETPDRNNREFSVWSNGSIVYVRNNENSNAAGELVIHDLLGREVFRTPLSRGTVNNYTVNATAGYYVASVVNAETVVNQKVYLK